MKKFGGKGRLALLGLVLTAGIAAGILWLTPNRETAREPQQEAAPAPEEMDLSQGAPDGEILRKDAVSMEMELTEGGGSSIIVIGPEKPDLDPGFSQPKPWEKNVLMEEDQKPNTDGVYFVFGSKYLKEEIASITFLDTTKKAPKDCWDVSRDQNGSVLAWVKPAKEGYDLSIAGEGGVKAPESCWMLFAEYSNVASIDFNGAFHVTSDVINTFGMFMGCKSLKALDLSGFDTSSVQIIDNMFKDCASLKTLDVSGLDTSSVAGMMSSLFEGCRSLKKLNLKGFETGHIQLMYFMFRDCESLESLDLSGFDTGSAVKMGFMFSGCKSLKTLDLSGFDTSNVDDIVGMFSDCESLERLDLSSFDTSHVTKLDNLFMGCKSLKEVNLENLDTSSVKSMSYMFNGCESLEMLDLNSFDTSRVTDMSHMFARCKSLVRLELGSFDTAKAEDMEGMFLKCESLVKLDLSNFNTAKVKNMEEMLYQCNSLRSLDLGTWETDSVVRYANFMNAKATYDGRPWVEIFIGPPQATKPAKPENPFMPSGGSGRVGSPSWVPKP